MLNYYSYYKTLLSTKMYIFSRSQCFPIQITGWPVELMAYAYLAVSPPSMRRQFKEVGQFSLLNYESMFQYCITCLKHLLFQMAAAASNKTTTKKDLRYPEIEEHALQFIVDACESSLSKYNKFLQVRGHFF